MTDTRPHIDPEAAALTLIDEEREGSGKAADILRRGRDARTRGDTREAERYFRAAMEEAVGDDAPLAGSAAYFLGRLLERVGNLDGAADAFRKAIGFADRAGLREWGRMSRNILARILIRKGETEAAEEILRKTLPEARDAGDRLGEGISSRLLGEAAWVRSNLAEAERRHVEAKTAFEATGEAKYLSPTAYRLGEIRERLGRPAEALETYESALVAAQRAGSLFGVRQAAGAVARVGMALSSAAEAGGETDRARALLERAGEAAQGAGDYQAARLVADRKRLLVERAVSRPPDEDVRAAEESLLRWDNWSAVQHLRNALAALPAGTPEAHRRALMAKLEYALHMLGHTYERLYMNEQALEVWRQEGEIAAEIGDAAADARAKRRIAELGATGRGEAFGEEIGGLFDTARRARAAGDYDAAIVAYSEAFDRAPVDHRRPIGAYYGFALMERSEAAIARGDVALAREDYRAARDVFDAIGHERGKPLAERGLAALPAEEASQAGAAADLYEEARTEILAAEQAADVDRLRTAVGKYLDALFRKTSAASGRGDHEEVRALLGEAMRYANRLGTPDDRRVVARASAEVEVEIAEGASAAGRLEEAVAGLRKAIQYADAAGDPALSSRASRLLGAVAARIPRVGASRPAPTSGEIATLIASGEEARAAGDLDGAIRCFEQALEASWGARAAKDYAASVAAIELALYAQGKMRLETGNLEGALVAYRRRLAILTRPIPAGMGGTATERGVSLRYARILLGNVLVQQARGALHDRGAAGAILQESYSLFEAAHDARGIEMATSLLRRLGISPARMTAPGHLFPRASDRLVASGVIVVIGAILFALVGAAGVFAPHPKQTRRERQPHVITEEVAPATETPAKPEPPPISIEHYAAYISIELDPQTYLGGFPTNATVHVSGVPVDARREWTLNDAPIALPPTQDADAPVFLVGSGGRRRIAFRVRLADGRSVPPKYVEFDVPNRLNINRASVAELKRVGFGPTAAQKIVDFRSNRPFTNMGEVQTLVGRNSLSDEKRRLIEPFVVFGPP